MITFTQNASRGQLYAECSQTGADYRIPTTRVEDFLAEIGMTLDKLLATPQENTEDMQTALAKYNG
ncbi:hypothetical protein Lepto7375DRAFT_1799 [Leptolyngbya sp. PCC 7375]|nr:hypothetical protein Lepto7375DRAFT_1799 [Leptolyngbya sp. PCC 7375]